MTHQNAAEFYDEFVDLQSKSGIHHRHLSIMIWLEKFKMPKNGNFLEIGCGIGTQTELILRYINLDARVTAIDISEKSIAFAKKKLNKYNNVNFIGGDVIKLELDGQFDAIILPDVLEHIPLADHDHLLRKLSALLTAEGFILIHIPNPNYLEWITKNEPEKLQIIDNPIHTNVLLNKAYQYGLFLEYLESYSIFNYPSDYQVIVLRKKNEMDYRTINKPKGDSVIRRLRRKLKLLIRGK